MSKLTLKTEGNTHVVGTCLLYTSSRTETRNPATACSQMKRRSVEGLFQHPQALAQACASVSPFLKVNECYCDVSPTIPNIEWIYKFFWSKLHA